MADFAMPEKWTAEQKLFPHHVGFTCPPFDYDAAPSDFLRMSPHKELKKIHRIQHWLAIPVYGLATLSWVFKKDFVKFSQKKIGSWPTPKHPRSMF